MIFGLGLRSDFGYVLPSTWLVVFFGVSGGILLFSVGTLPLSSAMLIVQ